MNWKPLWALVGLQIIAAVLLLVGYLAKSEGVLRLGYYVLLSWGILMVCMAAIAIYFMVTKGTRKP